MNWVKEDEDDKPKDDKPVPKKLNNNFAAEVQSMEKQRSATMRNPAGAPKQTASEESGGGDDFKNTLAAMLARGAGRPT